VGHRCLGSPRRTLDGMTAEPGPGAVVPCDAEHDPTATYALEPALARRLTRRLESSSGQPMTPTAPFTGQPIASIPTSSLADVAVGFERARSVQRAWAETAPSERAQVLLRYHDLVLDHQDELLDLIQWESGKARKHAFEEVAHVAMTARYYGRIGAAQLATRRRPGLYPALTRVDVHQVPKGVVGVISPWNYPLTMALADALPALMAGNAVVHKPDSQSVLTALRGVELLLEAGLPAELWQTVVGEGPVVGAAVVEHADHVCFTGSTATGRLVAATAADRLIGVSLELGGKNPMLVLRDADLDRAAEGAVRACFSSAGQLCVSMERIYVADAVFDGFVRRFVERVEAMRLAATFDYTADMGSLVSAAQLATVSRHVDGAVAAGALVLTGGRARPDLGPYFYEPTVLSGVRPGMECFDAETFGPVASVYRFIDETEAVARANDGPYGLNASIYTRDGCRGRELARRIRCGTVNVNEAYSATFGSVAAPMGGMRQSGLGRRQGVEGLLRYTEPQAVATQRVLPMRPVLGMSEERYAKTLTTTLRLLHRFRRP